MAMTAYFLRRDARRTVRPVATNTGLIVKIATAVLITFAATLVLVFAEIHFSDSAIMQTRIDGLS